MKKLTLSVTLTVEVEIDDRVTDKDLRWAAEQSIWREEDGRRSFAREMLDRGFRECAEHFVDVTRWSVASHLEDKYPGAHQRGYVLRDLLPEPKVHHAWQQPKVAVNDAEILDE